MKYKDKQRRNSKFIVELKNKATETELIVLNWLKENNKKFIFQKGFLLPFHRIVDFYIPGKKIIIEVDGGYHFRKDTIVQDNHKDSSWLKFRRMKTIRITNEQVKSGEFIPIIKLAFK